MSRQPEPTIFVIDDDEAVRDALSMMLRSAGRNVETFATAQEFIDRRGDARTGCIVLDVRMPGMSGLQLQEELLTRKASLPIVFVTGHGDVSMAVSTMKKGAIDFIEKPFNQADLKTLVDRLLIHARERAAAVERERMNAALLARLTTREQQVLERIVAGRLNKQIAADLGISIKTVEAHRANIMDKLEANTVADLMRVALRSVVPVET